MRSGHRKVASTLNRVLQVYGEHGFGSGIPFALKDGTPPSGRYRPQRLDGSSCVARADAKSPPESFQLSSSRSNRKAPLKHWLVCGNIRKPKWSVELPGKMRVLCAAGQTLIAGGPSPKEEKSEKGTLLFFSTVDGKKLGGFELAAEPVDGGIAAAQGRLFVSTQNGRLYCLGKE